MSDVVNAATKYQSQVKSELAKVSDFIRMAEDFMKKGEPSDGVVFLKTSHRSDSSDTAM